MRAGQAAKVEADNRRRELQLVGQGVAVGQDQEQAQQQQLQHQVQHVGVVQDMAAVRIQAFVKGGADTREDIERGCGCTGANKL